MKKILTAVFIVVFFVSCKEGPYTPGDPSNVTLLSQGVRMGPYLQAITADSVYVSVECLTDLPPVAVEYGPDASYGNTVFSSIIMGTGAGTFVHKIRMTGLNAGNYFHYRITRNAAVSDDYIFRTAVPEGSPFRFAWASDFQEGTAVHSAISTRIISETPDFSIYGGDIATLSSYDSIKSEFFIPKELELSSQVPFMFTVGNHEGWTAASRPFYQAPEGSPGAGYYSFDYGDMHVLVMNSEADFSSGSSQYNFAAADLVAATAKKWKVVSVHHPAYWSGGIDYLPFDTAGLRALVENVFEPAGVDLILSGHFHYYQHNLINGIHHAILATAGGNLDTPSNAAYTVNAASTYCYGIFDVDAVSMTVNVYDESGVKVDGFYLY